MLSAYITMGLAAGSPISSKYFDNHSAWVAAHEKAMNSASTMDRTTVSCLFVSHETGPPATRNMFPSIDCLVFLHPAKSESTYPVGFKVPLA